MNPLVKALHDARLAEQEAAAKLRDLRAGFDDAHAGEIVAVVEAKIRRELAEEAVKAEAMVEYHAGAGKKAVPGAEVKEFDVLDYAEPEAMAWAKGSGMCLTLDKKAFEKVAKATPEALPFVTIRTEPRVTLASDLSKFVTAE